jgi:hypothetical protein
VATHTEHMLDATRLQIPDQQSRCRLLILHSASLP